MATIEYWIQIENHAWDTVPHRFDRMTGQDFNSVAVTVNLNSPVTHATRTGVKMYKPLMDGTNVGEALILRRYTPNWAAPDDRKVNPWDLNEMDPTDAGTMGTIPGPLIECNAAMSDTVVVHFRNMDSRAGTSAQARAHSLHPHGFVFKPTSDGAYPLSPPDPTQPTGGEAALWAQVGVTGPNKIGDRVPPGGTFKYTWNTFGWPSTAGVWLYHDHSICDMDNVSLGAIGVIVIHNVPADAQNDFVITAADLPGGSLNGSPVAITCFPFPTHFPIATLPHDFGGLGPLSEMSHGGEHLAAAATEREKPKHGTDKPDPNVGPPVLERLMDRGGLLLEADAKFARIARFCIRNYRTPPSKALYLMLFHELTGAPGMAINGRVFLGNTPTMVGGTATKMRFGVVGMGNVAFHTFHIHGHRWIVPGPDGNTPVAIQGSAQVKAISQFEDTRIFGPANSFGFTIDEAAGSFMRAGSPSSDDAKGEWHMHCHVLGHMMTGMMGSLLIVGGGESAGALPMGEPCTMGTTVVPNTIVVKNTAFTPSMLAVPSGTTVIFDFQEATHSVTTMTHTGASSVIEINGGANTHADAGIPVPVPPAVQKTAVVTGNPGDTINFQCGIHGAIMPGMIMIS